MIFSRDQLGQCRLGRNRLEFNRSITTRVTFLVLAMVLFGGFVASFAWATVDGTISGLVSAPAGEVRELTVKLKNLSGGEITETRAQVGQEYQFFPVKLGDYELTVCQGEVCSDPQSVHVASGSDVHENLALQQASAPKLGGKSDAKPEMVVKVRAKKKLVQNISTGTQFELSQAEVRKLPQGSEVSLPKLIASTTAGVIPGSYGQLFIRGNHATIQYQLDGIQMPESPSSSFGQSFSPRNIDRMEVITGGIPAEFGQRLSAVVNVVTKSGPEKPEGEIELNYGSYHTISPHLLYGGTNDRGDLRYYFSLNYNQTDRGMDTPNPESFDNQKQGGSDSINNWSNGNSEFAKLDWQMTNADQLSLILFHSYSFYQIPNYPTSFDPSNPNNSSTWRRYFSLNYVDGFGNSPDHTGHPLFVYIPAHDTQAERNAYLQMVYKRTIDNHSYFQLAPYYKYASIVNTADPSGDFYEYTASSPILTTVDTSNPDVFSIAQNRHSNTLGLKGDYSLRWQDDHLFKTGFQLQQTEGDGYFSIQIDPNRAPTVFDARMSGTSESLYIQDDFTLHRESGTIANHLVLNAGLRFDAYQYYFLNDQPSFDYQVQPRVGLNYMADELTRFHLFYGRLFQPAPIENLRLAFTGGQTEFYDILAEKADFYEAGVSRQVFDQQVASANVFYKTGINFLDDQQLGRTASAQPFNFARGYVYGLELGLKGQLIGDWSSYINYSYLIAKGQGVSGGGFAAHSHGDPNLFQNMDHSQMHTANGGVTYSRHGFWWTTQALYGSGLWTGPSNNLPLLGHLTFDTTLGYEFSEKDTGFGKWKISADVLNLLDHRYPVTIANEFNPNRYAAGRQFFLRLTRAI